MAKTLYERLGGTEGITKIVDDVIENHLKNPIIKTRYINAKDLERARNKTIEFFVVGSGGPGTYTGKDMLTTHKGMNISEQEYISVMDDILGALDKNNVGEEERKDVLAIIYSLKDEIIRV